MNRGREPSEFERRVYRALQSVPRGWVTTYRDLAAVVGSSPRAVGQALKRNPFAPAVPCHRVIASNLSLGGFRGKRDGRAVLAKRRMLKTEGLPVVDGVLTDASRVYRFSNPRSSAGAPRLTPHV